MKSMQRHLWRTGIIVGLVIVVVAFGGIYWTSPTSSPLTGTFHQLEVEASTVTSQPEVVPGKAPSSSVALAQDLSANGVTALYTDALPNGWHNWSWGCSADFNSKDPVYEGSSAIAFTLTSSWGAFSPTLTTGTVNLRPFTNLRFRINGDPSALGLSFSTNQGGSWGKRVMVDQYIQAGATVNGWQLVDVPLERLGIANAPINRYMLQDTAGRTHSKISLDTIELYSNGTSQAETEPPTNLTVSVDANANVHTISPLVYGIAADIPGASSYQKEMGASFVRWGGNATTRFNWENNATNSGSDWYFMNNDRSNGDRTPGKASANFINTAKSLGMQSMLTIPTIGWVAKDTSSMMPSAVSSLYWNALALPDVT